MSLELDIATDAEVAEQVQKVVERARLCTPTPKEYMVKLLVGADRVFKMDFQRLLMSDKWDFAHDIIGLLCHVKWGQAIPSFGDFVPTCRRLKKEVDEIEGYLWQ